MGIGQDKLFCLFFLAVTPIRAIATHCRIVEGKEQKNNKSSENKYKETRGNWHEKFRKSPA